MATQRSKSTTRTVPQTSTHSIAADPKRRLTQQMLAAAVAAAEDKKAEDIRILALDPAESGLTDYFLICSGNSDRQNVAITDEIDLRLKREFGQLPISVEGRRQGEWILMDYVDFIVHVFTAEKRAFYGLERLRKSATSITVDELNAELKAAISATRNKPAEPATPAPQKPAKKTPAKTPAKASTRASTKAPRKTPAPATKAVKTPTKKTATKKVIAKKAPAKSVSGSKAVTKKAETKVVAKPAKKSAVTKPSAKKAVAKKSARK
jgi:ribosome-associated protein